jgi:predicted nuclease with TOPRIM domain
MKFFIDNWQIIGGVFTTIVAFFGGQKMKTIEEKKANSDAVSSMQSVYDNFVKDVESKYSEMRLEMADVKKEVVQLREENSELRRELRVWETKYSKLRAEFDKLTK